MVIRIGTRKSPLAILQATMVKEALLPHYISGFPIINNSANSPEANLYCKNYDNKIEIISIRTTGDRIKGSLAEVGGKGLFIKELEQALLGGRIDLAIHSLKDIPGVYHEELQVIPVLTRERPNDVFISFKYPSLKDVPMGGHIGTCSVRRAVQLAKAKNFQIIPIRGNIETRIEKGKNLDGILLSYCALKRLHKTHLITEIIPSTEMLPAVGQGALAAQYNKSNEKIAALLNNIIEEETRIAIEAERSFLETINGDCTTPLAALAEIRQGKIYLKTMLAYNKKLYFTSRIGSFKESILIGKDAAKELISLAHSN